MKNQKLVPGLKIVILFLFVFSYSAYTQTNPNSIYFEVLGNGGLYSFNYDKMFTESFGGRIGFMYLSKIGFIFFSINDLLIIPATLNYFIGLRIIN